VPMMACSSKTHWRERAFDIARRPPPTHHPSARKQTCRGASERVDGLSGLLAGNPMTSSREDSGKAQFLVTLLHLHAAVALKPVVASLAFCFSVWPAPVLQRIADECRPRTVLAHDLDLGASVAAAVSALHAGAATTAVASAIAPSRANFFISCSPCRILPNNVAAGPEPVHLPKRPIYGSVGLVATTAGRTMIVNTHGA
jgi:hypothetical protein